MNKLTDDQNELAEELLYHAGEIIRYTMGARADADPRLQKMKDDVKAIEGRLLVERKETPVMASQDFELVLAALERYAECLDSVVKDLSGKDSKLSDRQKSQASDRRDRASALIDALLCWYNCAIKTDLPENYMLVDLAEDMAKYDSKTKELIRQAVDKEEDKEGSPKGDGE